MFTIKHQIKMHISEELKKACAKTLKAIAYRKTIEPIVKSYQKAILEKYRFKASKGMDAEGKLILDPRFSYMLSDKDFSVYWLECKEAMKKKNLNTSHPDNCPLLEAKNEESKAKREMLDQATYISGFSADDFAISIEGYKKAVDLTLRYVTPHLDKKDL